MKKAIEYGASVAAQKATFFIGSHSKVAADLPQATSSTPTGEDINFKQVEDGEKVK
jgi:hypothetical protein